MKKRDLIISTLFFLFLAAMSASAQANLITSNAVGKVKLGMTIAEVRKAVAPMKLSRTSDGEGVALIAVKQGKNEMMTIYANEEDREARIDNNAKVDQVWVWSRSYKTASGVHPGMLVSQVEKLLGPVKEIVRSEIESREFAEFTNQPRGIQYRLDAGEGDFPSGTSITTKYAPTAKIFSINVIGDWGRKDDGIAFTSEFTDLHKGCKSVGGEEGGHVSTLCPGPGGFQVHYFDAATVYQLSVADARRDWEEPLTTFGLDKIKSAKPVEWRMANGVPFAAIWTYPGTDKVIVRGLPGFERIKFEGDGTTALDKARTAIDNDYPVLVLPATPIYFAGKNTQATVKGHLPDHDDKLKYRIKAKAGDRLKVIIGADKWTGEEGPIMVGIVTMPDGESDGAPGGTVFDDVLTQDGEYEILVYQNSAKSQTPNVDFTMTVSLVPKGS
jgi:hypothetical protein